MLRKRIRPSIPLTALLVAAVLLSGCSALSGQLDEDSERAIIEDVSERIDEVEGFTATQVMNYSGEDVPPSRVRVWARPGSGQIRTEVLVPEQRAGDVTVTGGESVWYYDHSENTATRTNVSGDLSPGAPRSDRIDEFLDRYNISYEGTTQLDGRATHKLRLTANESADVGSLGDGTVTMWVDVEREFPARITYEYGEDSTVTVRYTNVSINPGIDDERFAFDPPADATVETRSFQVEQYDSRSALVDASDRSVPDPTVPEGFEFESGTLMNDSLSLAYSNGSARLVVSRTASVDRPSAEGETVSVAGRDATYRTVGGMQSVRWQCGDSATSVVGDLSRTDLLAVADGVGCP